MAYSLNPYVEEQNRLRFHAAECHYIEELEKRGGLIRLGNVAVDAEQLVRRRFVCNTRWCLRNPAGGGPRKWKGSCCTDLEVNLTAEERARLQRLGQMAVKKLDFPERDPLGAAARRMAGGRFTEHTHAGDAALIHQRHGCCGLGWITRGGELRCAINALCAALNLPLGEYKPDPCILFPLHVVEHLPGQYVVTVICPESYAPMGADRYVSQLRCVRRPQPGAPPAYVALKYELIHCFGEDFYRALEDAAKKFDNDKGRGND